MCRNLNAWKIILTPSFLSSNILIVQTWILNFDARKMFKDVTKWGCLVEFFLL